MRQIFCLLSGVLLAAGVMDRYALTWSYLYIKDAIRGEDHPETRRMMNECSTHPTTEGEKKKMQLFLCVLFHDGIFGLAPHVWVVIQSSFHNRVT